MTLAKRALAATVAPVLLLSLAACSGSDDASDGSSSGGGKAPSSDVVAAVKEVPAVAKLVPADIKKQGSLSMAADLHYPPTSYLAEDNKTPVGFNVDVADMLGKEMGVKVQVKNVTFDSVIPGIAAGRYDFTATDMSPTPDRLKVLDMITYWNAGSSLVVAKGNPDKLGLNDGSLCGHTIAVMSGTTQQETYLPEISKKCEAAGDKAVKGVVLPNVQGGLTQLASKRVDGVFYDTSSLGWAAKQQPQAFDLLDEQYKKSSGDDVVALGIAKGSKLTPALHAAMQQLMDSPQYQKVLDKWTLGAGAISTSKVLK